MKSIVMFLSRVTVASITKIITGVEEFSVNVYIVASNPTYTPAR